MGGAVRRRGRTMLRAGLGPFHGGAAEQEGEKGKGTRDGKGDSRSHVLAVAETASSFSRLPALYLPIPTCPHPVTRHLPECWPGHVTAWTPPCLLQAGSAALRSPPHLPACSVPAGPHYSFCTR